MFKPINLKDAAPEVTTSIYNLAACVPYDGVPGELVPDPFQGASKMPGMAHVPFDPEDYDNRAASLEREAAQSYFHVPGDYTKLREPTADERAHTRVTGHALLKLQAAAHFRAYAAQLRGEHVRVQRDSASDERAKAKRFAQRKMKQSEEVVAEIDAFMRKNKTDIAEGKRLRALIALADRADRLDLEMADARNTITRCRNEIERLSGEIVELPHDIE